MLVDNGAADSLRFAYNNAEALSINTSRNVTANVDIRAPIFYDSNNTSYYADPASTSRFNSIIANSINISGTGGTNSNEYLFYCNASATQARRFEIARIAIDFNDWNSVGGFEVELHEKYFGSGLIKKYTVFYGYVSNFGVHLTHYSGSGANQFRVTTSGEVTVSGDHRYISIFVDVDYYSGVTAIVRTTRNISTSNPPPIGSTFIFSTPTITNIAGFSADSIVFVPTTVQAGGDFRAPIFYDSNDTTYYVDPNSTSYQRSLFLGAHDSGTSEFRFGEDSSGWYGDRWYWDSSYTTYRYSRFAGTDSLIHYHDTRDTTRITYGRNIVFNDYGKGIVGNYDSTRLQAVFAMGDSYKMAVNGAATNNMYGLAWSHPNAGSLGGANNLNDHGLLLINNGTFRAAISSRAVFSADVRGTLFYDYNDTGFYVDPNSTSRTYGIHSTYIGVNQAINTSWPLIVSGNAYLNAGGYGQAEGSWRAPIFYDSNDTTYYVDPNGTSRLNGLTVNSFNISNGRISSSTVPLGHYGEGHEIFSLDPSWTNAQLQAYFNASNVSWVADSTAPGGYAVSIVGSASVGGVYGSGFPYIPVDSTDVFYMEVWIRSVSGTNTHYMGSNEFNQSFSSLGGNPGSFGYWVMSNTNPGSSWVRYSGYITGFNASNTGAFEVGTKYWTPMALFNYTGGGTTYISGWKVIKTNRNGPLIVNLPSNAPVLGVSSSLQKTLTVKMDNQSQLSFGAYPGGWSPAIQLQNNDNTRMLWLGSLDSANRPRIRSGAAGLDIYTNGTTTDAGTYSATFESGSVRSPIFYDLNDTGYYVDPNGSTSLRTVGDWRANASAWTGEFAGKIQYHSNNWYFQYTTEFLFRNASGSNVFYGDNGGNTWAIASSRAPIFYDTNNTGYYADFANGTTSVNQLGNTVYNQYGRGPTGLYSASRLQLLFSMGPAYQLAADGTTAGNLYGVAWSHPNAGAIGGANNLASHGMLILENGSFRGAWGGGRLVTTSDIRGTLFYDYNNTGFYTDPASTSRMNLISVSNVGVTTGGTGSGINLNARNGGYLFGTTGDGANSTIANVKLTSWFGIGFAPSITGQAVPQWQNAAWIDVRNGAFSSRNEITAYSSDQRLKINFKNIENPIEKIKQIGGYEFDWDVEKCLTLGFSPSNIHEHGVKAQEVQKVVPDAVKIAPFDDDGEGNSRSGEDYLTVKYDRIVPLLIEAIKEQQNTIDSLTNRVNELTALVQNLINKSNNT